VPCDEHLSQRGGTASPPTKAFLNRGNVLAPSAPLSIRIFKDEAVATCPVGLAAAMASGWSSVLADAARRAGRSRAPACRFHHDAGGGSVIEKVCDHVAGRKPAGIHGRAPRKYRCSSVSTSKLVSGAT